MKRASYREAVAWIAWNDDCAWLDEYGTFGLSVSAALVVDIFGVAEMRFVQDLRRAVDKRKKEIASL